VRLRHAIVDRVLSEHDPHDDDDPMAVLRPDQAAVVVGRMVSMSVKRDDLRSRISSSMSLMLLQASRH
jgi:hypothetical protein